MIARNEDSPSGIFWPKKLSISNPETSSNQYKSKISNLTIELPKNPLKHVYFPKIDLSEGVWGGSGINSKNVAITATETITSNERGIASQ
jgi:dipeptidase